MVTALFLLSLAGDVVEPDLPRDPPVVREMQSALTVAWRACSADIYPRDPQSGAEKVSSVVALDGARATLTITFHTLDGTLLPQTEMQKSFVRCVKTAFEGTRFRTRDEKGRSFAIANPAWELRVVESGRLAKTAASLYVHHQTAKAKAMCGVTRIVEVVVDVRGDGSIDQLTLKPANDCLKAALATQLHFPATTKPAQVMSSG